MNELQVFNYGDTPVRTMILNDDPWWVLKDVCHILGIKNSRNAANRLDDDEKNTVRLADGIRGNPNVTIINESGLYNVIFRSEKPEAKNFKRWVTHEVLPAIRKIGAYELEGKHRGLTTDDYLKAAQIAATCRNERLPYVLGFLEQAGFSIPKISIPPPLPPWDFKELDRRMKERRMSLGKLSKITRIPQSSLSYYRRGIHKPPDERYKIILDALS